MRRPLSPLLLRLVTIGFLSFEIGQLIKPIVIHRVDVVYWLGWYSLTLMCIFAVKLWDKYSDGS